MKDQKKFNTLKGGLGNGMKVRSQRHFIKYGTFSDLPINGLNFQTDGTCQIEILMPDDDLKFIEVSNKKWLPHLFSLSMLTKEMVVEGYNDGKPFRPITKLLQASNFNTDKMSLDEQFKYVGTLCDKYFTTSRDADLMDQMHINWRELKEDQFIPAEESGVYTPKIK